MLVQDLVNESLTLIGRLGPGRIAGPSESAVVLAMANLMLDSWSIKRLTVYTVTATTHALAAGQEYYTIGTGGTWNTARPTVIASADIVAVVEGSLAYFPLEIIGQTEFAALETYADTSIIPKKLYNDGGFPLSSIWLYPIPSTNTTIDLYTWTPLTQFVNLTDTISSFPPGYGRAVVQALALEIAPAFGLPVSDALISSATAAKEAIESVNARKVPQSEIAAQQGAETQQGNKQ